MGRIRSLHPGQWSDEDFVACSMAARLLVLGLRNEADDNGVFEWKPITIKMRLFSSDSLDVEPRLEELVRFKQVMRYEIGGRQYGAIRNFRKFQRPKSPKSIHPITPRVGKYVALSAPIPETDDDEVTPFPQKGEISPQMEGGRREEEGGNYPPRKGVTKNSVGGDAGSQETDPEWEDGQ